VFSPILMRDCSATGWMEKTSIWLSGISDMTFLTVGVPLRVVQDADDVQFEQLHMYRELVCTSFYQAKLLREC
jgi:hypothetical protein